MCFKKCRSSPFTGLSTSSRQFQKFTHCFLVKIVEMMPTCRQSSSKQTFPGRDAHRELREPHRVFQDKNFIQTESTESAHLLPMAMQMVPGGCFVCKPSNTFLAGSRYRTRSHFKGALMPEQPGQTTILLHTSATPYTSFPSALASSVHADKSSSLSCFRTCTPRLVRLKS